MNNGTPGTPTLQSRIWTKLPGLYRPFDLEQIIHPGADWRVEEISRDCTGARLLAISWRAHKADALAAEPQAAGPGSTH